MDIQARRGDEMLAEIYKSHDAAAEQTGIEDTTGEGRQIEPQTYDIVGTSRSPPPT